MPSLTNTALDGVLNPVINALLASDPVSSRAALGIGTLYNVDDYNASGSGGTSTTGSISAASAALTVASASTFAVGQGIYIAGAGAAGIAHVTTITAINGLVLTLAANAATTVAGAVVQHDDSVAINAAIAACLNDGGGTVYLPAGHYRCNAPVNHATNSVLTMPMFPGHQSSRRTLTIIGAAKGITDKGHTTVTSNVGTTIDSSDITTVSGARPSVIAMAPFVEEPSWTEGGVNSWNLVDMEIDRLTIFVAQKKLSGINAHNGHGLLMGDHVDIKSKAPRPLFVDGFPDYDSMVQTDSYGIIFPAYLNSVKLSCGMVGVAGFGTGIQTGEHLVLKRPIMWVCHTAIYMAPETYFAHLLSGQFASESCKRVIHSDSVKAIFELTVEYEGRQKVHSLTPGSITAGSNQLTVVSAASFAPGGTIAVDGAGAGQLTLNTTITSIAGNVITLAANAATTVVSANVGNKENWCVLQYGYYGTNSENGILRYGGLNLGGFAGHPGTFPISGGSRLVFQDLRNGAMTYGYFGAGNELAGKKEKISLGDSGGTVGGHVDNLKLLLFETWSGATQYKHGLGSGPDGMEFTGTAISNINWDFWSGGVRQFRVGSTGPQTTVAGKTFSVKSGSNAMSGTFTANGTTPVAVATTAWDANCAAIITLKTSGGTGPTMTPFVSSVTPGTGFSVVSVVGDTSVYNWVALKVN